MAAAPNSPSVGRDPRRQYWVQSTKPELEGKLGSTFALANGLLGLRGAHEECPVWGRPEFYVAGTYAGGPASLLGIHDPDHILSHPDRVTPAALAALRPDVIWTLPNLPFPVGVRLAVDGAEFAHERAKVLSNERLLDMDQAILRRCLVFRDAAGRRTRVDSQRFVSMADRNLVCLRYAVRRLGHEAPVAASGFLKTDVTSPNGVVLWTQGRALDESARKAVECVTRISERRVVIAQHSVLTPTDDGVRLDLFAVAGEMPLEEALGRAAAAAQRGYEVCRREHAAAVADGRAGRALDCDADWATVQGLNFGLLHLDMAIGPAAARAGVPIKGLTGHGYRFVNFWDMDFHMFPYYLMTRPKAARDLLAYRYGQLNAYRENARRWGARGAQVPWETNTRGEEETAPWLCLPEREIHISADAAWMFRLYAEITGDESALDTMGAEFVMETARFYASRIRWVESRGRHELPDIGCPDQYHTFADNDVFISLMARWNLEYAASLAGNPRYAPAAARIALAPEEPAEWKRKAATLFIPSPNDAGIIEEFDGYFGLDPDLEGITESYCRHSQAVKQPDVLAATVRFEGLFSAEVRRANWLYYNARTLHGSSLSLPGMAHAAARCGLNDEALYNLHKSARMDLDDVNLDAERGVHVSGAAVAWQAIVFGFGGLTPTADGLDLRPNLPRQWEFLNFTVHWRGQRVRVELRRDAATVRVGTLNDAAVPARLGGGLLVVIPPGGSRTLARREQGSGAGFSVQWGL
jgi:kojibiose phosphorylase